MRPAHIENILVSLHTGQWFGWPDSKNKVYANLEIYAVNGVTHPKPSKASLESALAAAQAEFDGNDYARNRAAAYPSIGDQLDMQYHDLVDSTTTWADAIAAVKSKYPKPG